MTGNILHIHSGHRVCSVASTAGARILFYRESEESKSHHQSLPLMIQRALCCFDGALDAVHLYEGPGSYTGLRIGFSIVKGLCYGRGIPLICSDAGELHYNQFLEGAYSQNHCLAVYHARKNEIYARMYHREKGALWSEMRSIFIGEQERGQRLSCADMEETAVIGNAANLLLQDFPDLAVAVHAQLNASHLVTCGEAKWQKRDFTPIESAKPLYLKPPHINKSKKSLL